MRALRLGPSWNVLRWCSAAGLVLMAGCIGAAHTQSPGAAPAGDERSLPVPFDLQEGVERANILGTNLLLLDVATAHAQQALAERIGPLEQRGISPYIALMGGDDNGKPDGSIQVLFFTGDDVPRLMYRVLVGGEGRHTAEVFEQEAPNVVHEPLLSLLNARWLALEAVPHTNQDVNTVLLPQRSGKIIVYVLAASSHPNVAVLGRHYRVDVAEDGAAVESVTALSKAELELPTRDRSGQRLAALSITDGEADHPTETHVFASRLANVPLYVTTGRGRWKVRATGIDYLGPR